MRSNAKRTGNRWKRSRTTVALAMAGALLCGGLLMAADEETSTTAGQLVELDPTSVLILNEGGEHHFFIGEETAGPADLDAGEVIIVHHVDQQAIELLRVDATVEVREDYMGDERRAVLGTVTASSPDQVLVETPTGGQAFVVQAEKLFPPLPVKGDKVAVVYRVQQTAEGERAKGEEIVILPADTMLASGVVTFSSTPIEPDPQVAASDQPEGEAAAETEAKETAAAETEPVDEEEMDAEPAMPEPETQIAETLPQTASPFTLIGLVGAALLGGGLALRRRRQ